jgi:hypothetical protein
MDNSGLVVRINQPNDLFAKTKGSFCSTGCIQKLMAPAKELIQSSNTLKRLLDSLFRALQPRASVQYQELTKQTGNDM